MRSALLLSGNPRFCKDFDLQLENLTDNYIDWYVCMWDRTHTDDTRINPNWHGKTSQDLANWILPHLPPKHKLMAVELLDHNQAPKPTRTYKEFYANTTNLLQQFWILDRCNQHRNNSNIDYDLIIRTRPDITLDSRLNLEHIHNILEKNINCLVMPNNERRGVPPFCDQFAIAKSQTMNTYTQAYTTFDLLYDTGTPYNPEFLMAAACLKQGLVWPTTNFEIGLRMHGYHTPGHFHPDFGTWL